VITTVAGAGKLPVKLPVKLPINSGDNSGITATGD
jgi:hypothetical protein